MTDFEEETLARLARAHENADLGSATRAFVRESVKAQYSYNFLWQGRPIIQYPQDIVALQEVVWATRPDLIIETGIAHGGSLILSASLLALLDYADAAKAGEVLDPGKPRRQVLGVDIDIRAHNRLAIETHPLSPRIRMLEGSSTDQDIVAKARRAAESHGRVMVCLDSNHTHDHVLAELRAYAPLVTRGCYCIVFDTVIEDLPPGSYPERAWDKGNNPKTAVAQYLLEDSGFEVDSMLESKLQITVAPGGYLRRVV